MSRHQHAVPRVSTFSISIDWFCICHLLCVRVNVTSVLQNHEAGLISCSFSRCLRVFLESLSITHCSLSESDLKYLSQCNWICQLKHPHIKYAELSMSRVTHLQILLEKVEDSADPGVGELQEEGLSAQCTAVCPEPVLPAHLGQLLWQPLLQSCTEGPSAVHSQSKQVDCWAVPCPSRVL